MPSENDIEKAYLKGVDEVKALFKGHTHRVEPYIQEQLTSLQKQIHTIKSTHHFFADVYGELQTPQEYIQNALLDQVKSILMVQDTSIQHLEQMLQSMDTRLKALESQNNTYSPPAPLPTPEMHIPPVQKSQLDFTGHFDPERFLKSPEAEVERLDPVRLMVPLDNQMALFENKTQQVQLSESRTGLYHYLAFATPKPHIYQLVPRQERYSAELLRRLGMGLLFDIQSHPKNPLGSPLSKISQAAEFSFRTQSWQMIKKGKLDL